MSDDGNHGIVAICRNKVLNRFVRLAAVHLDSDTGGRRGKEAKSPLRIGVNLLRGRTCAFGFKRTIESEPWHWEWWGDVPFDGPCK